MASVYVNYYIVMCFFSGKIRAHVLYAKFWLEMEIVTVPLEIIQNKAQLHVKK
jgi:hypothetical protein